MRVGIDAEVVAEMSEPTAGAVLVLDRLTFGQTDSEKAHQATHYHSDRNQYPLHGLLRMTHNDSLYSPVGYSYRDLVLFTFHSRTRPMNTLSRYY